MACAQLEATGHEELALASLSTTDYSALGEVLAGLAAARPESRVSLPSLRVDSAAVRLAHLVSPTGPSLTLAPEAGSQRMRDLINKNVTEDDILTAVGEAFSCGYTTLKLYFIIGLPLEDDEDVEAIADLCLRIRELGRRTLGHRAGRLQMSVSINNFVPKPFTPFQWQGMTDRATIRRRQEILRGRLRKPGIRVALHDVDKSYLEAALARGDEDMSGVIERAWRGGARFDSWTEQFRGAAWREALESAGTTAEALATRSFDRDARLPWDTIAGVATKEFLWEEWERATRAETTPDCRHEECRNCGACFAGGRVDLARAGQGPAEAPTLPVSAVAAAPVPTAAASGGRYLLTFSVSGRARFVGHLDKMELFRRAVRRAGGRLALSAGLRPKALLSLAIPLGVGMEADAEICEFELAVPPPVDFVERLNQALPPGLRVISVEPYAAARHAAARVVAAEYEVVVEEAGEAAASKERTASQEALPVPTRVPALGSALRLGAQRFAVASVLEREELREDRLRAFDVKEYVKAVEVATEADGSVTLRFRIAMTPTGSVRPERVVITLGELAGVSLNVCRAVRKRIVLS
jgi:hypothetical protein